jgi:hypothetical protein
MLLGPMAVAGGGQFHHLRHAGEIASAFTGELGGLFAVVAGQVRLELEVDAGVTVDVVSAYWAQPPQPATWPAGPPAGAADAIVRWSIAVGDLMGGEERHVVVRFGFPARCGGGGGCVRARLLWWAAGSACGTDWRELRFTYADDTACDREWRDPGVMHWAGLHHADRARREAATHSRRGDLAGARRALQQVARRIAAYAGSDRDLQAAVTELQAVEHEVAAAPAAPLVAKEIVAESYRRSRGQPDVTGTSA